MGRFNAKGILTITTEERLKRYLIWQTDNLVANIFPVCSKIKGTRVSFNLSIVDLDGISLSFLSKQILKFIQYAAKMAQDNYPEIMGKFHNFLTNFRVFLINCPKMISVLWAGVKGFIDKKTRTKFTFLGKNYKEELLKYIDEDNLPAFYGGKDPIDEYFMNCQGPWRSPITIHQQKDSLDAFEVLTKDHRKDSTDTMCERDINESETQEEEKINKVFREFGMNFKNSLQNSV